MNSETLNLSVPWLFYYKEFNKDVNGFYYQHSDEDIEKYCKNIAEPGEKLKDRYNLEMIFLPVPCKYLIYHKFINQFPVIKLFDDFINSEKVVYRSTDTHCNQYGPVLANDITISYMKSSEDGLIAINSNKQINKINSGL